MINKSDKHIIKKVGNVKLYSNNDTNVKICYFLHKMPKLINPLLKNTFVCCNVLS